MGRGGSPFAPGAGLDPPYLAGREPELRMFDGMLRGLAGGRAGSIAVCGMRGAGKTALLGRSARACRDGGLLALARRRCGPGDSDPRALADGIRHTLRSAVGARPRAERAAGGRRTGPRTAGCALPAYCGRPYPRGGGEPLADHLAGYLAGNWGAIDGWGTGERCSFSTSSTRSGRQKGAARACWRSFSATWAGPGSGGAGTRSSCPACLRWRRAPGMRDRARGRRSAWSSCRASPEDARLAVAPEGIDRGFSPGLVDAIAEDAGGCPYLVQPLASEALERLDGNHIGLEEYMSIRGGLIREIWRDFFSQRMADLCPLEAGTLRLVSTMPGAGMAFSSILAGAGCGRGALSSRLRRLEAKGLVRRRGRGRYGLALPLLGPRLASGQECSG